MREGWGPKISATLGWIVMEAPSPLIFLFCWLIGEPARRFSAEGLAFFVPVGSALRLSRVHLPVPRARRE
jgi:hypothetical protein